MNNYKLVNDEVILGIVKFVYCILMWYYCLFIVENIVNFCRDKFEESKNRHRIIEENNENVLAETVKENGSNQSIKMKSEKCGRLKHLWGKK